MNVVRKYLDNIKCINYYNPEYIYIIHNGEVNKEYINKDEKIGDNISSISGYNKGSKNMYSNNKVVNTYMIENDYKEIIKGKNGIKRNINDIDKDILNNYLKKYFNIDINNNYKKILVNGIDIDPFEYNSSYLIDNYVDKLLETIDAISVILNVDDTVLVIDNNNVSNVSNTNNNIGTYPNISLKIYNNDYPYNLSNLMIDKIFNKTDIENGILVLNIEQVYLLYYLLKRGKPITEKIITVSGNKIDDTYIYNVKKGMRVKELLNQLNMIDNNYKIIMNGLLCGIEVNENEIIGDNTRSIFISEPLKEQPIKCIKCGLCNIKCPVGLNPIYLKNHIDADRSKCINCGLCSYVCPSKINFKEGNK